MSFLLSREIVGLGLPLAQPHVDDIRVQWKWETAGHLFLYIFFFFRLVADKNRDGYIRRGHEWNSLQGNESVWAASTAHTMDGVAKIFRFICIFEIALAQVPDRLEAIANEKLKMQLN